MDQILKQRLAAISIAVPGLVAVIAECADLSTGSTSVAGGGFSAYWTETTEHFETHANYNSQTILEDLILSNSYTECGGQPQTIDYEVVDSSSTGRSGYWYRFYDAGWSQVIKSSSLKAQAFVI